MFTNFCVIIEQGKVSDDTFLAENTNKTGYIQ